jgi:tetratricopeptide (TPR) repeat protein
VPESFLNFVITDEGMIYGTTLTDWAQIKKINGVGKNLFPDDRIYGERMTDTRGKENVEKNPELVDIAVDANGVVTVVDRNTCNLYQYGQDGKNIGVFGGPGLNAGSIAIPSSLAVDSAENLYVLDSEKGSLQVLAPTQYCRYIHSALAKYNDGRYFEAVEDWEQVLQLHAGNRLAHIGIGKALYKQGRYPEAMAHYRIARDRGGYSDAFREARHEFFRSHFIWVVLAAAAIVALAVALAALAKVFAGRETR